MTQQGSTFIVFTVQSKVYYFTLLKIKLDEYELHKINLIFFFKGGEHKHTKIATIRGQKRTAIAEDMLLTTGGSAANHHRRQQAKGAEARPLYTYSEPASPAKRRFRQLARRR